MAATSASADSTSGVRLPCGLDSACGLFDALPACVDQPARRERVLGREGGCAGCGTGERFPAKGDAAGTACGDGGAVRLAIGGSETGIAGLGGVEAAPGVAAPGSGVTAADWAGGSSECCCDSMDEMLIMSPYSLCAQRGERGNSAVRCDASRASRVDRLRREMAAARLLQTAARSDRERNDKIGPKAFCARGSAGGFCCARLR